MKVLAISFSKTLNFMFKLICLPLCLFFSHTGFSAGVLAYKIRSNQPDPSASIILYRNLSESSRGSITVSTAEKAFIIERSQFVDKIEILESLPPNIIDDTDVDKLRKQLESYQNFVNRFNRSKPLLEGFIEDLFRVIRGCEAGSVRFKGEWMNRDKMLSLKKIEEDILSAQKQKSETEAREKALFVESQKAKGLSFFNGKWMPVGEARALFETQEKELLELRKVEEDLRKLGEKAVYGIFKVVQVTRDGSLGNFLEQYYVKQEYNAAGLPDYRSGGWFQKSTKECFVKDFKAEGQLIDGYSEYGWFVEVGVYAFISVRGGQRTVLKMSQIEEKYIPVKKRAEVQDLVRQVSQSKSKEK